MAEKTDQLSEAGAARRRALKAGVGVGVGAIAWSGPTITSIVGTPAYAAACTVFTVDEFSDNRNTNQSFNPFEYQDDTGILFDQPATFNWNWVQHMHPGDTITFNFDPALTCWVEVWLYPSQGQGGSFTQYWGYHLFGPDDDGQLEFELPGGEGTAGAPLPAPNNYSNTRFAVQVRCTDKIECLPDAP